MDLRKLLEGLREFLTTTDEFFWVMDPRVHVDGGRECFYESLMASDADLLATEIRTRADDPEWNWWSSLIFRDKPADGPDDLAALLPLTRYSRAAAEAVLEGWGNGWQGFAEALVPTLVNRAGLKIEDIGGDGRFTPEDRKGRWYASTTWHWESCREFRPGRLHFPLPRRTQAFAAHRIDETVLSRPPRLLYVVPAGGGAPALVVAALACFQNAGADCLVLQYDDSQLALADEVRLIRDPGHKWQLARRHLAPEAVAEYDFIFFWDDDLAVDGFDPVRFAQIMSLNRLAMAQPAIESPHGLSHAITGRRPSPSPLLGPTGSTVHRVVGRLTNFVEIMAPVFTRVAWREFHGYLTEENRSGWGYDFIPLGRKGIIDLLPVVHTRAVQSLNADSERELKRFLESQGLFRHSAVEQGLLFESC